MPHFHDGYLNGIRLRESAATIHLEQLDGLEFELKLEGLEALQIEDFREGNVIALAEIIFGQRPAIKWI